MGARMLVVIRRLHLIKRRKPALREARRAAGSGRSGWSPGLGGVTVPGDEGIGAGGRQRRSEVLDGLSRYRWRHRDKDGRRPGQAERAQSALGRGVGRRVVRPRRGAGVRVTDHARAEQIARHRRIARNRKRHGRQQLTEHGDQRQEMAPRSAKTAATPTQPRLCRHLTHRLARSAGLTATWFPERREAFAASGPLTAAVQAFARTGEGTRISQP
jgi:hypothetical protein